MGMTRKLTGKEFCWKLFQEWDYLGRFEDRSAFRKAGACKRSWTDYDSLQVEGRENALSGAVDPATGVAAGTVVVDESSGVERVFTFVALAPGLGQKATTRWGWVDYDRLDQHRRGVKATEAKALAKSLSDMEQAEDDAAYEVENKAATCRVVCEDGEMCGREAWLGASGRLASNAPNVNDGGPLTVEVLYAHQEYAEDKELPSICSSHGMQSRRGASQWKHTGSSAKPTPENLNEELASGLAGNPRNDWEYHESLEDLVFVDEIDSSYAEATCTRSTCKTTGIKVNLGLMRAGNPVCPKCYPSDRWDNSASFDSPGDAYDALEAACSDADNLVERLSEDEYLNGVGAPYERLGLNVSLRCLNETQDAEGNDTGVCNTVVSREPRNILDDGWACRACQGSTSGQGAPMFYRDRTSPASVRDTAVYVKSTREVWLARGTNRRVVKPGIAAEGRSRCKVDGVDATVLVRPRWQAWCVEQMLIEYLEEIGGEFIDENSPLPSATWGRTETFYDLPEGHLAEFVRWAADLIKDDCLEKLCDDYLERHPNGGNNRTSDNAYVGQYIHEIYEDYDKLNRIKAA